MFGGNWRSNVAVGCGVVGGILLAWWFSTVVALGPAPGNVLPGGQQQPPQRNQTNPAANPQPAPDKEKQDAASKEAECSNPGQTYHDCLIQLRTARATERQADVAKSTERVAWIALLFAAGAAVAAWSTFWIMRKTAERQLRAYVFVDSISLADSGQLPLIPADVGAENDPFSAATSNQEGPPGPRPAGIPGVSWVIKNYGATPAYDVVHWGVFDIFPTNQENLAVVPDFSTTTSPLLKASIAPSSSNTKSGWYHRTLTAPEMAAIRNGAMGVYVYGRIEYRDAFKKTRFTNYRMKYTYSAYPPVGPTVFNYCDQGNDAK